MIILFYVLLGHDRFGWVVEPVASVITALYNIADQGLYVDREQNDPQVVLQGSLPRVEDRGWIAEIILVVGLMILRDIEIVLALDGKQVSAPCVR